MWLVHHADKCAHECGSYPYLDCGHVHDFGHVVPYWRCSQWFGHILSHRQGIVNRRPLCKILHFVVQGCFWQNMYYLLCESPYSLTCQNLPSLRWNKFIFTFINMSWTCWFESHASVMKNVSSVHRNSKKDFKSCILKVKKNWVSDGCFRATKCNMTSQHHRCRFKAVYVAVAAIR